MSLTTEQLLDLMAKEMGACKEVADQICRALDLTPRWSGEPLLSQLSRVAERLEQEEITALYERAREAFIADPSDKVAGQAMVMIGVWAMEAAERGVSVEVIAKERLSGVADDSGGRTG